MAHGDYNCCAICDCKMEYNAWEAETKESVCVNCIEKTIALGRPITRADQIQQHLAGLDDTAARDWLAAVGFNCCFYPNPVDDYAKSRGFACT